MKVQFRSILFALVLPAAACGGDRETPSTTQSDPFKWEPKSEAPQTKPVQIGEQPKAVDVKAPLPTKYDEALAMGRELLAAGKYGDAKEMLQQAIKLDKKKAEPYIEMARLNIATNEKAKSIANAKQAIKLAPLSSQAWNTKGRAELNAHNYDNAIEAFSKAVELNQDNVFAWNNLGYTELLLKKYDEAAEHLAEATSRNGATGFMFNNLGTALEHLDRLDDARMAYEAGGKLGSKEAASSRKRLEGVTSIAIADTKTDAGGEVHDQVRGEAPKVKEYELTDENAITDEDAAMETKGSAASEEVEADEVDDKIETTVEPPKVEAPVVDEPAVEEPTTDE
ncbi:MAG TPA: tetratricopeptide repeat protein [Kofleriaceae bacterium]